MVAATLATKNNNQGATTIAIVYILLVFTELNVQGKGARVTD